MAVGLDADTDYITRGSIPSGGTGTLTDGAFKNCICGTWLYRPSTTTHALSAGGSILHMQASARNVVLGFNATGTLLSDLSLQITFNSDGSGVQTFASHAGNAYLDEWVYYFILDNSTSGQIAGYILQSDLNNVADSITRANDNAGSQYCNTLVIGNVETFNATVAGRYAFARARYGTGITTANALTYAASDATISGDWGFWPLADNADTGDDSGNSRTLTFGGTLTSETSPTLGGGGPTGQPMMQRVGGVPHAKAGPPRSGRTWKQRLSGIIHPDIPPLILPSYRTPRSFVSFLLPTRFA